MPIKTGFNSTSKTYHKLTGYPCNLQVLPYHCILTNTSHQTIGDRNPNPFSMTFITAHTGALRQGQPSIPPFTKRRSHPGSRNGESSPT
eukprot:scaffold183074_cov14-Tisochrysis_lutea.AAC.1